MDAKTKSYFILELSRLEMGEQTPQDGFENTNLTFHVDIWPFLLIIYQPKIDENSQKLFEKYCEREGSKVYQRLYGQRTVVKFIILI